MSYSFFPPVGLKQILVQGLDPHITNIIDYYI